MDSFPKIPDFNSGKEVTPKAVVPPESSGTKSTARNNGVQSSIDSISDLGVDGWVMISHKPLHRCIVGLKEADQIVSRAVASRFRADLLSAGIGDGCHAFFLPMPRSMLDGLDHFLQLIEIGTGAPLTDQPIRWRSTVGTAQSILTKLKSGTESIPQVADHDSEADIVGETENAIVLDEDGLLPRVTREFDAPLTSKATTYFLFDVSDLIYHIGHVPNLTGIQRVQSCLLLSIVANELVSTDSLVILSYNLRRGRWSRVPTGFFISVLKDLFLPTRQRSLDFLAHDAQDGILPGAEDFDGIGTLDDGTPSVFCLLGAAWVHRDYFHRVMNLRRQFGTRVVVTIHDLIPVYARETCDPGTALVFEQFLRRALRHADHFLCVSDNTAKDLKRFAASRRLKTPSITVTQLGSSFDEFLPTMCAETTDLGENFPARYVLFVATIEGRKNHVFIFDIWRRMHEDGEDPPHLICVGRMGWKAESFVVGLVETDYLNGKIMVLKDVSDAHLKQLYARCLFTVFPSLYEGWGLPIGESLAAGKLCVCSNRASLPEVASDFAVYVDIEDVDSSYATVNELIKNNGSLQFLESRIVNSYRATAWHTVAERAINGCLLSSNQLGVTCYPLISYGREVSFASPPGRESVGVDGEAMVRRISDSRTAIFLYHTLQEEDFLHGEDARTGKNWAEPENWGTWLCNSGGEIVLELEPSSDSTFFIFLRCRASGPASELPIRLLVDDVLEWNQKLGDGSKNIMLTVHRKQSVTNKRRLRIRAEVSLTSEIYARISGIDRRVPTIGFERLVVLPHADIHRRIDLLSKLLT